MTTHYQISDDEDEDKVKQNKNSFKQTIEQIEEIKINKNKIGNYLSDYFQNSIKNLMMTVTEKWKRKRVKAKRVNKSKRDSSNSERGSDEEEESKARNNMFFMKYYKNIILRNDPLHNESEKLVKFRHQLVLQAWYIDYICQSKLDEAKDMIIRPVPRELGKLMLTIVRDKSGFGRWYPKYTLVSYISNENLWTFEKEIIVGKKRSRNKLATYMISLDKKNPTAKGEALCGKLKMTNK